MSDLAQGGWCEFPVRLDAGLPDDFIGIAGTNHESIFIAVQAAAIKARTMEAALVERRILEGDDRVMIKHGDATTVYTVPDWKTRPVARIKVERARRKYRRSRR